MFKLCIEWDFGQDNIVFTSKERAIQWFNGLKQENFEFEDGNDFLTYQTLENEGLALTQELTVI